MSAPVKHVTFEGRIRRVWKTHKWMCEVYGTEQQKYNGVYDLADDIVEDAKRLSRVPQKLAVITYSWKKGQIIRIEPLENEE